MPDREASGMSVPECVPVLVAEQLIFYLAGGGLLLLVGGRGPQRSLVCGAPLFN